MTVYNEFAKVFFTLEKLILDPEQVFFALLSQRHAWFDASVRKESF